MNKIKINKKNIFLFLYYLLQTILFIFFGVSIFVFKTDIYIIITFILIQALLISYIVYLNIRNSKERKKKIDNIFSKISLSKRYIENNPYVGYVIYDERYKLQYYSNFFNINNFKINIGSSLKNLKIDFETSKEQFIKLNQNYFFINVDKLNKIIFFINGDKEKNNQKLIEEQEMSIISIEKFYSKKLMIDESAKSTLDLKINDFFNTWSIKNNAILKRDDYDANKITIFVNWKQISNEIENSIFINNLLSFLNKNLNEISISIGVSRGYINFSELEYQSKKLLEIAENRGGNQLIYLGKDDKIISSGTSSLNYKKNNKSDLELFYSGFIKQIKNLNKVFITSHFNTDADSLASSLAFYQILKFHKIKSVYIVIETFDETSQEIFKTLDIDDKLNFITEKEAINKLDRSSGVVILDVSSFERTQAKNLIKEIERENRFIVDHHRTALNIIGLKTENFYINPSTSSTSEIVTNFLMLEYKKLLNNKSKKNIINEQQANLLLLGIYLDTNNLTRNTLNLTYECLNFLSTKGAYSNKIYNFIQKSDEFYDALSTSIKNIKRIEEKIIFTYIEDKNYNDSVISSISDFLLNSKNTEAVFILGVNNLNNIKLSARSNSKFNVQLICEKLGGGGHFNIAAASWDLSKNNFKKIKVKAEEEIKKFLKNNEK